MRELRYKIILKIMSKHRMHFIFSKVERVIKNKDGFLDLDELEKQLAMYDSTKHKLIGLFPAASRITGIHSDDVATTILLHQVKL